MLRKYLTLGLLAAVALIVIVGCSQQPMWEQVVPETYYNGYLDLAVEVPVGWEVNGYNAVNMTEQASDSVRIETLDKVSYGDGNYYIDLLEMSNFSDQNHDDYVRIHLFAEDYKLTLPELKDYIAASKQAYAGILDDPGYYANYVSSQTVTLGGNIFSKLIFLATSTENKRSYYQEYYICELEGLYYVAYGQYWVDNDSAKQLVYDTLNNIRIGGERNASDGYLSPNDSRETRIYYNDIFQLQVKVPAGYVAITNDDNLSKGRRGITEIAQMQRQDYSDGGHYYDLIRIQNSEKRNDSSFAQLDIFVEEYDSFYSFDQYIEAAEKAYLTSAGSSLSLTGRESLCLEGVDYEVLTFYSQYGGSYHSAYFEKYYMRMIDEYYFVACLRYMENSDKSIDDAEDLLVNTFGFFKGNGDTL